MLLIYERNCEKDDTCNSIWNFSCKNKISRTSLPDLMYILEKDFQTWLIRSVHINILLFKTKLKFTVLQPNCRKRLGLF